MKKIDLIAVLNTLESAEAEFEQLIFDNEWYVSDVTESITDAKARIEDALRMVELNSKSLEK